ncbi:AI-2E family transporter [Patescibacteria group bacterium]|nr:AI-2E family transporter [Patescibacteria group bacterium]
MPKVNVTITFTTLLKIVAVILGIWVLWMMHSVIAIFLAALFLSALMQPLADWGSKYKIPKSLTVIGIYVFFFGLLGLVIVLMVPTITQQAVELGKIFGQRWSAVENFTLEFSDFVNKYELVSDKGFESLQSQAGEAMGKLFNTLTGIFGGIAAFVIVLVIAFYLVVQEDKARVMVREWISPKHRKFALRLIDHLQIQISRWLSGQLMLSLIIALMTYVALALIGVRGALVLALFAGMLEFVPYLGPILSGIPIVFVAFTQSTTTGFLALGALVVIQQSENHLIVPKVMQKAVGLNPLISILSMLTGATLFGLTGALLAIPFATAAMVVVVEVRDYLTKRK